MARWQRSLALLLVVVVLAGACGGDSDSDSSSGDDGGSGSVTLTAGELADVVLVEIPDPAQAATAVVLAVDDGYLLSQIAQAAQAGDFAQGGMIKGADPARDSEGQIERAVGPVGVPLDGRFARGAPRFGPEDEITNADVEAAFESFMTDLDESIQQAQEDTKDDVVAETLDEFGDVLGASLVEVVVSMVEQGYSGPQIATLVIASSSPGRPEFDPLPGSFDQEDVGVLVRDLQDLLVCAPEAPPCDKPIPPTNDPQSIEVGTDEDGEEDPAGEDGDEDSAGIDGRYVGTITFNFPESEAFELVEIVEDEFVVVISDGQVVEATITASYSYRTCGQGDGVTLVCTVDIEFPGAMVGGPVDISSGSASIGFSASWTESCEGPEFECKDYGEGDGFEGDITLTLSGKTVSSVMSAEGYEIATLSATRE